MLHSARCVMITVDFVEIEAMQQGGNWEAGAALADAARSLEWAGADCIVLCITTMHKVADAITAVIVDHQLRAEGIEQSIQPAVDLAGVLGTKEVGVDRQVTEQDTDDT